MTTGLAVASGLEQRRRRIPSSARAPWWARPVTRRQVLSSPARTRGGGHHRSASSDLAGGTSAEIMTSSTRRLAAARIGTRLSVTTRSSVASLSANTTRQRVRGGTDLGQVRAHRVHVAPTIGPDRSPRPERCRAPRPERAEDRGRVVGTGGAEQVHRVRATSNNRWLAPWARPVEPAAPRVHSRRPGRVTRASAQSSAGPVVTPKTQSGSWSRSWRAGEGHRRCIATAGATCVAGSRTRAWWLAGVYDVPPD